VTHIHLWFLKIRFWTLDDCSSGRFQGVWIILLFPESINIIKEWLQLERDSRWQG
jgi:hypothetical protein